jgi:hypothetical protein
VLHVHQRHGDGGGVERLVERAPFTDLDGGQDAVPLCGEFGGGQGVEAVHHVRDEQVQVQGLVDEGFGEVPRGPAGSRAHADQAGDVRGGPAAGPLRAEHDDVGDEQVHHPGEVGAQLPHGPERVGRVRGPGRAVGVAGRADADEDVLEDVAEDEVPAPLAVLVGDGDAGARRMGAEFGDRGAVGGGQAVRRGGLARGRAHETCGGLVAVGEAHEVHVSSRGECCEGRARGCGPGHAVFTQGWWASVRSSRPSSRRCRCRRSG